MHGSFIQEIHDSSMTFLASGKTIVVDKIKIKRTFVF